MTVLNAADIRNSGAATIPDLLRRVPGVQVMRTAPGQYVISLRGAGGLTSNNVVVTLDSMPINSLVDGTVDWLWAEAEKAGLPVGLLVPNRVKVVGEIAAKPREQCDPTKGRSGRTRAAPSSSLDQPVGISCRCWGC